MKQKNKKIEAMLAGKTFKNKEEKAMEAAASKKGVVIKGVAGGVDGYSSANPYTGVEFDVEIGPRKKVKKAKANEDGRKAPDLDPASTLFRALSVCPRGVCRALALEYLEDPGADYDASYLDLTSL